ncbi:hypothetical protein, partial [Limnospira platensis]|uniref:hypothetical protein n=1 Tax=Limnospira platensis TaxID=118562 RepID=UPI003D6E6A3A
LHSTQPTRVYRIPGKRSHHPTPCLVGFGCTPPNLQESIGYLESDRITQHPALLGSVALHPTYKTVGWVKRSETQHPYKTVGWVKRSETQHPVGKHIPLSKVKKPGFSQKPGF